MEEQMINAALTEQDDGKTFQIHKDAPVVVHLTENPSTGYQWMLDTSSPEDDAYKVVVNQYSPQQPTKPGSGGTRKFQFMWKDATEDIKLIFMLKHPWDPVGESIKRVVLHFIVRS
jgi:predicted secreted protein